jgi:hypothetical protein
MDDYDEIVRVMQLYIDGFNGNDIGKFRASFWPTGSIGRTESEC